MGNFCPCCRKNTVTSKPKDHRLITPNHLIPSDLNPKEHPNYGYLGNRIKTTKYSIYSFIPKNLFEQFHRVANLYFIFIVLLNWVPEVNAFAKEIAMIPVIGVMGVTAIKDAFEDYRRYKMDKKVNHTKCRIYSRDHSRYTSTEWQKVKVGDIIHLSCNEVIPADILLLRSSDPEGICHIETANLDGENNLKQREVVRHFQGEGPEFHPSKFKGTIECELPNPEIYKFHGGIIEPLRERISINKHNLVLRGCVLRNTDFVEGIVVYAGHETKAMLNNRGPRYKRSKLERQINRDVIACVVILLFVCFFCAIGSGIWRGSFDMVHRVVYIPFSSVDKYKPAYQGFIVFWTYVIIFQVMIPLSLYVTIEIVKLGQVYFIQQDVEMYDPVSDKRLECRALNIPEELGQVQFIFSDKTGTLTENKMVFKKCTIGGLQFAHTENGEADVAMPFESMVSTTAKVNKYLTSMDDQLICIDSNLHREVSNMSLNSLDSIELQVAPQSKRIHDFFLLMAICNTVVVSGGPHKDKMNASGQILDESMDHEEFPYGKYTRLQDNSPMKTPKMEQNVYQQSNQSNIGNMLNVPSSEQFRGESLTEGLIPEVTPGTHYEAESPDELALVRAAGSYGCRLLRRNRERVGVWLPGDGEVEFEVLHIIPFDSLRKRMSVVVMHPVTKEIIVYCKGADSQILTNLDPNKTALPHNNLLVKETQKHLTEYAKEGLRTLCMAKKILSTEEYKSWLRQYQAADCLKDEKEREKQILDLYCQLESNLELLGATGIEDRLQEGVPETIAHLRQAGINIWVLTGDKQETALNIAYSCKLFSFEQELIVINAKNFEVAQTQIEALLVDLAEHIPQGSGSRSQGPTVTFHPRRAKEHKPSKEYALVIDGKSLSFALNKKLEKQFMTLAKLCNSVLICRATPNQKAAAVKSVGENLHVLTLAIGDGANDVNMIQTADVGVGISGQEGMQAVMASDFAMARFRFLERLLLVHGHWCYDRLARVALYMFYKNSVFIFLLFWYQIYNGFSGSVMIDQYYLMLFNVLFTCVHPVVIGWFDRDLSPETLLAKPRLYRQGLKSKCYQPHSYWINILDALYQSLIMYFIPHLAYAGSNVGIWEFGTVIMTACVAVVLLHIGIETKSWTWIHWVSLIASFLSYFGFAVVFNFVCITCGHPSDPYYVIQMTLIDPRHWVTVVLTCFVALLPRIVIRTLESSLLTPSVVKARLWEKLKWNSASPRDEYLATWSSTTSSASFRRRAHASSNASSNNSSDRNRPANERREIPIAEAIVEEVTAQQGTA